MQPSSIVEPVQFLFCTKSAATNINQMEILFPIVPVGSFLLVAVLCSDSESASIRCVPNNAKFSHAVAFSASSTSVECRAGLSPAGRVLNESRKNDETDGTVRG